ncbi:MAG: 3-deoxy-D-manno-octulosonic acid transferase, partial [Prolixibacteraceae bacterium]
KAFFVKYDYWYFFISELKRRKIPLFIISAIFRDEQFFFRKDFIGKWYRQMLFFCEHLFVQDEKSAKLLKSVGVENCTVSGDTRFDRVSAIAAAAKEVPLVDKFKNDALLIVAGSTWKPDEELLAAFINQNPEVKIIIAPHEVTPENINNPERMLKKPSIRLSKAENAGLNKVQVLIIDSVGLLSSLYRYGDVAYIGGGFGAGIHNILEAATFGVPVIFGPAYRKFKEAVDLKKAGGAFAVSSYSELKAVLNRLLTDEKKRAKSSGICKKYIEENTGATNIIVKKVFNI